MRIDFVKKARLEHIIDDLLNWCTSLIFGLKTNMCSNNNSIYSHQDFDKKCTLHICLICDEI